MHDNSLVFDSDVVNIIQKFLILLFWKNVLTVTVFRIYALDILGHLLAAQLLELLKALCLLVSQFLTLFQWALVLTMSKYWLVL